VVDQPHRMVVVEDDPEVAFYTTVMLEKRDCCGARGGLAREPSELGGCALEHVHPFAEREAHE
jgi:hypothetical protein